jgi:hypothetical protein
MVSNLALFYFASYLATFKKIGQFFPNHLVTLLRPWNNKPERLSSDSYFQASLIFVSLVG